MVYREPKYKKLDDDLERLQRYLHGWLNFAERRRIDKRQERQRMKATPEGRAKRSATKKRNHARRMLRCPEHVRTLKKARNLRRRERNPEHFKMLRNATAKRMILRRRERIRQAIIDERLAKIAVREANAKAKLAEQLKTMPTLRRVSKYFDRTCPIYQAERRKRHLRQQAEFRAANKDKIFAYRKRTDVIAKQRVSCKKHYDKVKHIRYPFAEVKKIISQITKEINDEQRKRKNRKRIERKQFEGRVVDYATST